MVYFTVVVCVLFCGLGLICPPFFMFAQGFSAFLAYADVVIDPFVALKFEKIY